MSNIDALTVDADACFERAMALSSGRDGGVDMIEAHKWFNIAAARGNREAIRLRREVAEQMSDSEIGVAQRAARDWLKQNPQEPAPVEIRAAA